MSAKAFEAYIGSLVRDQGLLSAQSLLVKMESHIEREEEINASIRFLEAQKKSSWDKAASSLDEREYARVVELHRGLDALGDGNGEDGGDS